MPRDGSGNYTLPLADVVGGNTILADGWANPTLADVAQALTDSLSRTGQGGLLSPLQFANGVVGAPSITFTDENTMGFWRPGSATMNMVVSGTNIMQWTSTGALVWNNDAGALQPIATVNQLAEVTLPTGTADFEILRWDESTTQSWQVAPPIDADSIPYDPAGSTTPLVSTLVEDAINELDANTNILAGSVPDNATFDAHVNDTTIHAPLTGGANAFEVVATLPGSPDPNTIYFVTT